MSDRLPYEKLEVHDKAFNHNLESLRKFYPDSLFEVVKVSYEGFKCIFAKNFPTNNYFYVEDDRVNLFAITNSLKIPSDKPFEYEYERNFSIFLVFLDNGGPYSFCPLEKIQDAITDYKTSFDDEEIDAFETLLNRFNYPEENKQILEAFRFAEDYFTMRPGRIKMLERIDERQLNLPFPE